MSAHRKYCTEDFMLTRVMRRPPGFIYLAALTGFLTAGLIYLFVINALFFRGGLPLAFGLMILVMMLVLRTQEKTLTLYLDEKSLFIDGVRYLRNEIHRIEMSNPHQNKLIRFRMRLKDGRRVYITDTRLFGAAGGQQAATLQQLINAIKKRLEIEPTYL